MKIERNSLCICGSGKKFKKCCLPLLEHKPIQVVSLLSDMHEACDNALAQIEAGNLLSAEVEAERLYDLYPDDDIVNFLQGVCHIQRECYKEAISFFDKAIQINPWFSEAYFNLASLYREEIKIPQSVACFRKIIEIEGEDGDVAKSAKKELDWLDEMLQKISGETLEEYLQILIIYNEAFACLKREDYPKAIVLFQQVIALSPDHVQSHGNIALAYSALGEQKMALQYLDKALLLDPTYEPAQHNRKNIIRLKEGEKSPFMREEVSYYAKKYESEGQRKQKPILIKI